MSDPELLVRIKAFVSQQDQVHRLPVATREQIAEAERILGFELPLLLKSCYLEIGNGGFAGGNGVIGVGTGHHSDFGDIVGTYDELKRGVQYFGRTWEADMLPFCEWGCNIFSCVKCVDARLPMFTVDECRVWPEDYTLNDFFHLLVSGEEILGRGASYEVTETKVRNPFTGGEMTVRGRKRVR